MKKNMFRGTLAAACAAVLLAVPVSSEAAVMQNVGMPNPMVSYDTVQAAAKEAGFQPLYLPEISGYHVDFVYVISKNVVDIGYTRDGDTETTLRVRTARASSQGSSKDLSGVYSVKWQTQTIDNTKVSIAKVEGADKSKTNPDGYAAHWQIGDMLYSVSAEHIAQPEFMHLLKDGLLDLSEHYYH